MGSISEDWPSCKSAWTVELARVAKAGAFATGTPDGLRSWLRHYATAVEVAAAELTDICSATSG